MAPETIGDDVWSTKSDVWSFGITCWEILTFGKTPYGALSAPEIADEIRAGRRLELPRTCSEPLSLLVGSTWEAAPKARPTFSKLLEALKLQSAADSHALMQLRSRTTWLAGRGDGAVPARRLELGRQLPSSGGFSRRLAAWTSAAATAATATSVHNLAIIIAPDGSDVAGAMSDLSVMRRIPAADSLLGIAGHSRLPELGAVTVLHCDNLRDQLLHEVKIPRAACWQACLDVARALEHLHAHGTLLRTLTPMSCHVTRGWRVRVLVINTAPSTKAAASGPGGGSLGGATGGQVDACRPFTPWTAPETLDAGALTSASNVHTCGSIFWGVYNDGAAPWAGSVKEGVGFGDWATVCPPLDSTALPDAMQRIVEACHRPAPNDRPALSTTVTSLLEGKDGTGWEISRDRLEGIRTLGAGNFGDVMLMLLSPADPAESGRIFVAAKSLRDRANATAAQEFLAELELMKSLRHPHLVQLHGAVRDALARLPTLWRRCSTSERFPFPQQSAVCPPLSSVCLLSMLKRRAS